MVINIFKYSVKNNLRMQSLLAIQPAMASKNIIFVDLNAALHNPNFFNAWLYCLSLIQCNHNRPICQMMLNHMSVQIICLKNAI